MLLIPNRYTDQWNRIENPEINPDTYGQLIFDKGGKNIKWETDTLQLVSRKSETIAYKSKKLEYTLTLCTKINFNDLKT